jgi:OOP family OmpA-OmpF porin
VFRFSFLIALLCVTACVSSLVKLQKSDQKGSPFQIALSNEYLIFSESEADQYDWFESSYFAKKGLKLAKGEDVQPEDLTKWDLPEDVLPTIKQAREYLVQALNDGAKKDHPEEAARAQLLFDCWVEQQEENWQIEQITYCRENFYNMLDRLYAFENPDAPDPRAEVPMPEEKPVVKRPPQKRVVYFSTDKFALDDKAKRAVSSIAAELRGVNKYEITLNGYADSVGTDDHNMQLSKKRADTIKKAFLDAGIKSDLITVFAFGETHGLVESPDGVAKRANRAVEIVLDGME